MDQRNVGRIPGPPSAPWLQPKIIVVVAIALFLFLSAWLAAFNTQAGTVDIVLRWGSARACHRAWAQLQIPYVETRHTVELREHAKTKASRDPMELNVTVALNWAVNKEHVILM